MTIGGITGEMRMADGTLSLSRLRMQLFGGTATASGSYSTASDPQRPALQLSLGLSGASFSKTFDELEMVQKLVPVFAKTGGDYSLSLDMSATLDAQMSPDLQSVNATGEIKSANIRIQNIEAFDALAKALNNDNLRKIEAKDVAIRFAIRDGRIATEPFDLKMGDIRINMSGCPPGRFDGRYPAIGQRRYRRHVHLAQDHARCEGGRRTGREERRRPADPEAHGQ